jgi:hypothetical protein
MSKNSFPIILLAFGMLLQVNPSPLHAYRFDSGRLIPAPISSRIEPIQTIQSTDLDGNGIQETLALNGGILSIYSGEKLAWQSPAEWRIVQVAITDLNHDGQPEVTLLLWRPFRPWPVDQWLPRGGRIADFHDAEGQSCHLILIGWRSNGYHELWAGSALAEPITSFAAADLDGDNAQELGALEGRYSDPRSAPARLFKVWKWNGFGFTVVSSVMGKFDKLTLVQDHNGQDFILVP